MSNTNFYKINESDTIWWANSPDRIGEFQFSFDKKHVFNLFADYPEKLTAEQKKYSMMKTLNGPISSKTEFKSKGKEIYTFAFCVLI